MAYDTKWKGKSHNRVRVRVRLGLGFRVRVSPIMALGQAKGKLYWPFTFCIFVNSISKRNVVHLSPV